MSNNEELDSIINEGTYHDLVTIVDLETSVVNPALDDPEYATKLTAAEGQRTTLTQRLYNKVNEGYRPKEAYAYATSHVGMRRTRRTEYDAREAKKYLELLNSARIKENSRQTRSRSRRQSPPPQHGGTYLPAEYHGSNSGRYSATPAGLATGAYGAQIARSQGVIHGDTAGPNLAYSGGNMMTGGKRTRRSTKKTHRRKHTKTGKTKKQKAGCGCARPGW